MITYRAMTVLDIPVVVGLERSIFKVDPWSVAQFKEEIAAIGRTRHYLVAEMDQKIVAYAGACVITRGRSGRYPYPCCDSRISRARNWASFTL
jgi:hypothetical protein